MIGAHEIAARRWLVLTSAMVSFFAVGMTFFAVPPLIPTLRAVFALSNLSIGLLMGAIAVPAILLSIPLGAALDRWPPRTAGLAGLAAMLVGAVAFAAAPGFAWLLAARLIFGVGGLVMNLLLARLIAVAFAGRQLALAMGLFTGVYHVSMIVLFSLHPWLAARLGWRGELVLLAALVVVAIPLHAFAVPRGLPMGQGTPKPGAPRAIPAPLLALGLSWMLYFVAFAPLMTFAPEWAGGGASGLLVTSVITWVAMFGTPLAGAAIDRAGRPHLWGAASVGLMAAALAAMAAGAGPAIVAMAALGVVAAVAPPAFYSLPGRLVPAERIGFAFGLITALSNLGTLAGPALAGAVRDATPSWALLWGSLAGVALVSAVAAALARPRGALSRTPGYAG